MSADERAVRARVKRTGKPFATPVRVEWDSMPALVAEDCELILSTSDATRQELDYIAECINVRETLQARLEALIQVSERINARQHAGLRIQTVDWCDLHDATNAARAALAGAA